MNFGLVGMGASIALLTQIQKNNFLIIAMLVFGILVIFEAIGLQILEKKHANLGNNPWYVSLWFFNSTFYDILLLVGAMVFLGLGTYYAF